MGGAPCKVVIDDNGCGGMLEQLIGASRQLQRTLDGIDKVINDLDHYLSDDDRAAVLKMSYGICDFGSGPVRAAVAQIEAFNAEVFSFFKGLAEKYAEK